MFNDYPLFFHPLVYVAGITLAVAVWYGGRGN